MVVRSDGEPALLAHARAARAMTMVSDVPLESVHEQVNKEQSPGNGLAEGAVKELKVKIRTLRHSTEMGLGRRILGMACIACSGHDQLVSARARREDTYELRGGAQVSQTSGSMGTEGLVVSAQEGIFLGILGGGVGASDFASRRRLLKNTDSDDCLTFWNVKGRRRTKKTHF